MRFLLHKLEHAWRHFVTLLGFSVFGLWGVTLSLTFFNLLLIVVRDPQKRIRLARRAVSGSFRFFLWFIKTIGVLTYEYKGLEQLEGDKGCLVLANHPTLLDYVLIAAHIPELDCLVKSSLLNNPFLSGVIKACHYLPNDEHDILWNKATQRLEAGDNILIFPEGTRTTPGQAPKFHRGAANLAIRTNAPMRLIHIHNSEIAFTKQTKWYHIPDKKLKYTVTVGKRFTAQEVLDPSITLESIQARRLTHHLESLLS